jgi:Bifunctional DNA primase/polymerase, N-terminal
MSGAFAAAALELRSYGLAPIPCSANDDGKVPGLRTKNWKQPPGAGALRQLVLRFPEENVGILTGPSHLAIVDIDDTSLVDDMLRRFGGTPIVVQTPSGGHHLYYRGSGERCANLRGLPDRLPVDVKAVGGFVVCPPSWRPSGTYAGRAYRFMGGGWGDLCNLPTLRPGSLPGPAIDQPDSRPPPEPPIPDGTRHSQLLRLALKDARCSDSLDGLLDRVSWINECRCIPKLPNAEVADIVRYAWQCQVEGRNFANGGQRVFSSFSEVEAFQRTPTGADASLLISVLRMTHFGGQPFAVSPTAMARGGVMAGWSIRQYREARALLVELGSLVLVHSGGRGRHDPALFSLAADGPARTEITGPLVYPGGTQY